MKQINTFQRIIIAAFTTLTAMILIFTTLYSHSGPALYLKFGVRAGMLLTVILLNKKFKEQKYMLVAFFFTFLSDYFFVLLRVNNPDLKNREMYGMLGFILAYIFIILAFKSHFKLGKKEAFTIIPFVLIFTLVLVSLREYAVGFMFWAAIVLGVVLCVTGMVMVSSIFTGYYRKSVAYRIAISGIILFLSDMVVAFSIFHPAYKGFLLWKENIIWVTYMLGWTLLLSVMAEIELTDTNNLSAHNAMS
ncbi:MAG: lysoplasmalogenase family protein [Clostridiaceae bacterium]